MRSLVVYESMYGNTHHVAEAVADGLREFGDVAVVPVNRATPDMLEHVDLLVVGGPTHVHGMSRPATRESAVEVTEKDDTDLELDPDAGGEGVREWLGSLDRTGLKAAAFDTRVDVAAVLTGRASKGIARHLRHHGFDVILSPESFLVTKDTHLKPGEDSRARRWGEELGVSATRALS
jgi:hypothetical protein